jgi:lantibiotic biosynthesis protein
MYQPLINTGDPLYALLEGQIHGIAKAVYNTKDTNPQSVGILGGKSGQALLFGYLSKQLNSPLYYDWCFEYLDELQEALANEDLIYTMSYGIGGVAFVFAQLQRIGVIDPEDDLNLEELDGFLAEGADVDHTDKNWDPLHGFVGLGAYFLERSKVTDVSGPLKQIVDQLWELRIPVGEHHLWMTKGYEDVTDDNYNFGMAHGMPGIISFLAQAHAAGIEQEKCSTMIIDAMDYILKHQNPPEADCLFPTLVNVNPTPEKDVRYSRLGWCYGDLCIINALIHSAKALKKEEWMKMAIDMALNTAGRSSEKAGCNDACFCHGSVGLVHQFNRLYQLTGRVEFKDAALRWLNETLDKYYKEGEGVGGYYYAEYDRETKSTKWAPSAALLEGASGIAIVYASLISPVEPDWDIIYFANV